MNELNKEITGNINSNSQSTNHNQTTQTARITRQFGKLFSLLFAAALIVCVFAFSPVQAQETSESPMTQASFPVEEQNGCEEETWLEVLYNIFGAKDKIRAECEQSDLMDGRIRR